ncbi:MAG: S8 family serine peptidase, partial [bacterium]
ILVVIAAGNGQQSAPEEFVGSPGTASKALTVGAINRSDSVSNFSSRGNLSAPVVKPDVVAPGGSGVTREAIVSVDSNDRDSVIDRNFSPATEILSGDAFANDYSLKLGTSIASPHVAGVAALLADALQRPWDFDSGADALRVKKVICMTASEVQSGESASPGAAGRAASPKDNVEGYGRVNAKAAVDALTRSLDLNTTQTGSLGDDFGDDRVWARRTYIFANSPYDFSLSVPAGADFDLYLYNPDPTPNGEPVIAASSAASALGGSETVSNFVSTTSGYYCVVVKRVSGDGTFQFIGSGKTAAQDRWQFYE